jgi:hypothetical protein
MIAIEIGDNTTRACARAFANSRSNAFFFASAAAYAHTQSRTSHDTHAQNIHTHLLSGLGLCLCGRGGSALGGDLRVTLELGTLRFAVLRARDVTHRARARTHLQRRERVDGIELGGALAVNSALWRCTVRRVR